MRETAEAIELKKHQFRMLIYISILLFVVFAGFTIYWEINYHATLSGLLDSGEYVQTEAIVIDHTDLDGKTYDVVRFDADGVDCERVYFEPSNRKVGTRVVVYYEASNPSFGGLMGLSPMRYWFPIITVAFGGVEAVLLYLYYSLNIVKMSTIQKSKKNDDLDISHDESVVENTGDNKRVDDTSQSTLSSKKKKEK